MSSSYITRQAVPKIAWGASGIPLFLCQLICNVKALAALVVLCVARYVEPVRSLLFFFFLLLFFFCCHNFRAHRGIGLKHPSIHFGCPASRPAKSFFQTTYTSTHQRRLPRIKILRLSHHDRSHPWNLNLRFLLPGSAFAVSHSQWPPSTITRFHVESIKTRFSFTLRSLCTTQTTCPLRLTTTICMKSPSAPAPATIWLRRRSFPHK